MENEFVEKKSKKKIAIVVLIIGLLLVGSGVGYHLFTKEILDTNKYLTKVNNMLTGYVDNIFDRFNILDTKSDKESKSTGNLSFKTDMEDLEILNSYGLDYSLTSSLEKEEVQFYLSLLEDKKDILNGTIYLNKDTMYFNSLDLYEKVLGLNLGTNIFEVLKETGTEKLNLDDINTIINNLIKYYFEAMKLSKPSSEIIDFTKVKYTFELNDNNLEIVENKFLELVKNDDEIGKLFNDEKFYITLSKGKFEIVIGVINNKLYNLNILSDEEEIRITNDKEEKDKYTITGLDNKINLYVKKDKMIFKVYEGEELSTLELLFNDKQISIDLVESNNSLNFTFKNIGKDTIGLAVNISIKEDNSEMIVDVNSEIKKNSSGYVSKVLGDFKMDNQKISFSLNDNTIYGDDLLTSSSFDSYVDINTLTEDNKNLILSNLMKKLEGTKLMDLLSGTGEA